MNQPPAPAESVRARAAWLPPNTFAGFAVAVLAVVLISFFSLRAVDARNAAGDRVLAIVGERARKCDLGVCAIGALEENAAEDHGQIRHRGRRLQTASEHCFRIVEPSLRKQQHAELMTCGGKYGLPRGRALEHRDRGSGSPDLPQRHREMRLHDGIGAAARSVFERHDRLARAALLHHRQAEQVQGAGMLRLFREHLGDDAFRLVRAPGLERGRRPLQRVGGLRRPDLLCLAHHAPRRWMRMPTPQHPQVRNTTRIFGLPFGIGTLVR